MAQTQRRTSPPLEEDWPGERDPGRLDAEIANSPVETSFVQAFRQALLTGRGPASNVDFFDEGAELSLQIQVQATDDDELSYPLILFSGVEYPPDDEVAEILQHFWLFHSSARFLSCVPKAKFQATRKPPYLLFAMLCVSLVFSPNQIGQQSPETHWWTATALIHGMMEVDNREARNMSLVIAWILLETYGVLHTEPAVWHRTNITQGYVETVVFVKRAKLGSTADLLQPQLPGICTPHNRNGRHVIGEPSQLTAYFFSRSSIMSYFLTIDLFRAIHYGLPANLTVAELFVPLPSTPYDLSSLYKSAINEPSSLPLDLASDHVLLLLVASLADIHALGATFLPLTETIPDYRTVGNESGSNISSRVNGERILHNPYLPFSPQKEALQANKRLSRFLDVLNEAYIETLDKSIVSLYYFCRMLLVFPHLQALVALTGYPPRTHFNTVSEVLLRSRIAGGLLQGEKALQYAWLILESLDDTRELEAVWLPIVVFYSGLVVWGMITFEGQSGVHGSLKVLSLFCTRLDAMRWPCCRVMALHLQALMTGPNHGRFA